MHEDYMKQVKHLETVTKAIEYIKKRLPTEENILLLEELQELQYHLQEEVDSYSHPDWNIETTKMAFEMSALKQYYEAKGVL
jgi:hypothetical protein